MLTDTSLQNNAVALLFMLNSSGCSQGFDADVQTFQSSWNASGGTPALATDGLYGAKTQASLQAVINDNPSNSDLNGETAPNGCVAPGAGPGGGGTLTTTTSSPFPWAPVLIGTGVVAALGLGIYAAKHKRKR